MREKIIVTGAGGNIGIHIIRRLALDYHVIAAIHNHKPSWLEAERLDITDISQMEALIENHSPVAVVNAAAIADANVCQQERDLARSVNIDGAANVSRVCAKAGVYLVHISTDLVFDGRKGRYDEDDRPSPLSHYGKTKAESELVVRESCPDASILRTAIVYGAGSGKRPNFFQWAIRQARDGKPMKIFTDEYRSFLYVEDSAEAVAALIGKRPHGIFHAGGDERQSRYVFTIRLLEAFNLPTGKIETVKIAGLKDHTPRPADCSLSSAKLKRETGWAPTPFAASIEKFAESLSKL